MEFNISWMNGDNEPESINNDHELVDVIEYIKGPSSQDEQPTLQLRIETDPSLSGSDESSSTSHRTSNLSDSSSTHAYRSSSNDNGSNHHHNSGSARLSTGVPPTSRLTGSLHGSSRLSSNLSLDQNEQIPQQQTDRMFYPTGSNNRRNSYPTSTGSFRSQLPSIALPSDIARNFLSDRLEPTHSPPIVSRPMADSIQTGKAEQVTDCSKCGISLELERYVCRTCGEKQPLQSETPIEGSVGRSSILGHSTAASRSWATTTHSMGCELCSNCLKSFGIDHSIAIIRGEDPSRAGVLSVQDRSTWIRSAPRQEGQFRHAFVLKRWVSKGSSSEWEEIDSLPDGTSRCSGCQEEISRDRYKCASCALYVLCTACYKNVHDIHPIHAFLAISSQTTRSRRGTIGTQSSGSTHTTVRATSGTCDGCRQIIVDVHYECASCPAGSMYRLCSSCENDSGRIHDPMHIFVKILSATLGRPRSLHLPQELYKYSTRRNGSISHLQSVRHDYVLCDRHGHSIVGKWFHCVDCRRDLCADCEDIAEHDSSHVSIVFKSVVDTKVFRSAGLE